MSGRIFLTHVHPLPSRVTKSLNNYNKLRVDTGRGCLDCKKNARSHIHALGFRLCWPGSWFYSLLEHHWQFPAKRSGQFRLCRFVLWHDLHRDRRGKSGNDNIFVNSNSPDTSSTVGLYTDQSGEPGELLESWTIPTPMTFSGALTTITSDSHPLLSAGTQYWFVRTSFPTSPCCFMRAENDTGVTGGGWEGSTLTGLFNFTGSDIATAGIELTSSAQHGSELLIPPERTLRAGVIVADRICAFWVSSGRGPAPCARPDIRNRDHRQENP